MRNYNNKLNKYLYKLQILKGGLPFTLRPFVINTIIYDIKELIFEYAKEFNVFTWEKQQVILSNIFNGINLKDDLIQDKINEINNHLPSFSLIWDLYYELLIEKYYYLFLNFPTDRIPTQNEILNIIYDNIKDIISPSYRDPIIIKNPDSDTIIPISNFCKSGFSKLASCVKNKCGKIHFPDPFNLDAKCRNDSKSCRNFEKGLCSQFHKRQQEELVFENDKLIGIKVSSLNKLPTKKDDVIFQDGRIVLPKQKEVLPVNLPFAKPLLGDYLNQELNEDVPLSLNKSNKDNKKQDMIPLDLLYQENIKDNDEITDEGANNYKKTKRGLKKLKFEPITPEELPEKIKELEVDIYNFMEELKTTEQKYQSFIELTRFIGERYTQDSNEIDALLKKSDSIINIIEEDKEKIEEIKEKIKEILKKYGELTGYFLTIDSTYSRALETINMDTRKIFTNNLYKSLDLIQNSIQKQKKLIISIKSLKKYIIEETQKIKILDKRIIYELKELKEVYSQLIIDLQKNKKVYYI